MKKAENSAGFVQVILTLIVVVLIGGAYYFGKVSVKPNVVVETLTNEPVVVETQKSTPDSTSNWRKITLLNWSFMTPNNWKYSECNKSLLFVGPNIDKDSSEMCEFDGFHGLVSISRLTDKRLFKIPTNIDPNIDPFIVKKENIIIDGKQAIKQLEKVSSGMGEGQKIFVYVISPEYMDTIVFQDVSQEKVFDQILSTFKFTK